jgi:mono/diheme cytochrome c family protein
MRVAAMLLLLVSACDGAGAPPPPLGPARPDARLTFTRGDEAVASPTLAELAAEHAPVVVTTRDPHYGADVRFVALPLAPILRAVFGESEAQLRAREYLLEAADGYRVPVRGEVLFERGVHLAVDDVESPGFAPIGERRVSPGPAYLVYEGATRTNLETHPRPYQLVTIRIATFAETHPHTAPAGLDPAHPAHGGFLVFRDHCVRCHAINREGGRVGPELNVPRNILEYRDEATVRAFVRAPSEFRYSAMPDHRELSREDLDALMTYLRVMGERKHDPGARP